MNNQVVTRFCPSNTGWLHMGSARTAVFAYAYARKMGGRCILRIENTDKKRSTHESLLDIMEGLEWLGLKFDDGPSLEDVQKGIYNPKYFQSERTEIYNKHIDALVVNGKAFINDEGVTVFRMTQEDIVVKDLIIGDVKFPKEQHKDFPIRRADGSVLFHACVVIDDALSGVTHVIRANDHLSNTPKHIKLYEAFGFPVPQYAHMPLILDDKGAKLSKRREDQFVLIKDFRANGYLPEVVINMLGLMGWSAPDEREQFNLDYMCQHFDLADCLKANSKYDAKKLARFNATAIGKMGNKELHEALYEYIFKYNPDLMLEYNQKADILLDDIADVYVGRAKTLKDPFDGLKFLLDEKIEYSQADVEKVFMKSKGLDWLTILRGALMAIDEWTPENIMETLNNISANSGQGIGKIVPPLRLAVTGSTISPPIDKTLMLLGKTKTMNRIAACEKEFQFAGV